MGLTMGSKGCFLHCVEGSYEGICAAFNVSPLYRGYGLLVRVFPCLQVIECADIIE